MTDSSSRTAAAPAAARSKVLVFGFGNPGRLDDGLGPALADAIERLELDGVTVDADYQLVVDDAVAVAEHDVVVFADADTSGPEPFYMRTLEPNGELGFSTHSCRPDSLLALANTLFHGKTRAYILGIRGYDFNEFGERLSEKATENLEAAVRFLTDSLKERSFREFNGDEARARDRELASPNEEAK